MVRTLHDDVVTALGLAPEELMALRQQGKTLAQIAQERGVDLASLEAKLVQARNAAIDEALKNGSLSEAQAAWMKRARRWWCGPCWSGRWGRGPVRPTPRGQGRQ